MSIGGISGSLGMDASGFIAQMEKSAKAAAEFQKTVEAMKPPPASGWDKFSKGLLDLNNALGIGQKLAQFGGAMMDTAKDAIHMASAFEETTNVMNQAFGKQAADMEAWSATTADAMGRSTQWMRETSSTLMAMSEPMLGSHAAAMTMSKGFTQLAVDLGSFWNVADSDALGALRSGLTGETEPLKKFGIVMTEASLSAYALSKGIKDKVSNMSEAQKTTLRYNYIVERTSVAHGDAQRTADGYANTWKGLQADMEKSSMLLGQQMLPAWQDLVVTFRNVWSVMGTSDWSGAFTAIGSGIKTVADMFLQAAQAAMVFLGTFDQILGGANETKLADMHQQLVNIRRALAGEAGGAGPASALQGPAMLDFGGASSVGGKGGAKRKGPGEIVIDWAGGESTALALLNEADEKLSEDWLEQFNKLLADSDKRQAELRKALTKEWGSLGTMGFSDMAKKGMELSFAEAGKKIAPELGKLFGANAGEMGKLLGQAGDALSAAGPMLGEALGGVAGYLKDALESAGKMIQSALENTLGRLGGAAVSGNAQFGSVGKGVGAGGGFIGANWGAFAGPWAALTAPVVLATGAFIGLTAGLIDLSTQTESYQKWQKALGAATQPLVKAMEPLWAGILPLAAVFGQVNVAVAQFLGLLIPGEAITKQLFYAFKWTGEAFLSAALFVARGANELGANLNTQAIAGALHNLQDMTFASAMAAGTLTALSEAAEASMNVPQAAVVNYQRYLALGGGQGPDLTQDTSERASRGGVTYVFNGEVHFSDVQEMMTRLGWDMAARHGTATAMGLTARPYQGSG